MRLVPNRTPLCRALLLRQEVDGPPQGKAPRDSIQCTEMRITHMVNPLTKTRIAGQLRQAVLALPRPHTAHSRSQETSLTTHAQKASLEAKGELCRKFFDTPSLCGRIHLGEEMRVHKWEDPEIHQIWTVNQANQNNWPNETQKKCPIKVIQTTLRA